jgi:hypothetical protein
MSHLSDKEIDHLAREAAEQLDVDQNSSGWEALQAKLDVEMPVEKRRRRWLLFLLFPLLGGGLFLAYKLNQPASSLTKQSNTRSDQTVNSKAVPGATIKDNTTNGSIPEIDKSSNEPLSNGKLATGESHQVEAPSAVSITKASSNTISATSNQTEKSKDPLAKSLAGPRKPNKPQGNKLIATKSSISTAIVGESGSGPSTSKTAPSKVAHGTDNSSSIDPLATNSSHDSLSSPTTNSASTDSLVNTPNTALKDSTVASSSTKPVRKKTGTTLMPEKGFVFGLIAGPDVSKVNGTGTDERGFNTGILGGYRFNGRLSLISGVNYTHKYYTAKGADYKPAKGTWLDTVSLSKVVGECFMFEVPVNVRYDLLASKKNYAFASAGLSSYFMQQEDYDFHYTTNSGYYNSRYKSYKVSEQYWFSVLNLSVGYERMLTKRLSLQVEPYLKLPLNGIGFGNMDLSSYGVFFGVRYHAGTLKAR